MRLPAGLIDNNAEFFTHPADQEKVYVLSGAQVTRVQDAPQPIKQLLRDHLTKHPEKALALSLLGYRQENARLEKLASCAFGAFDNTPDIVDGQLVLGEFWPCPVRAGCPYQGILCSPLMLRYGVLTPREIEILTLVGKGKLDKEIASELELSRETVKVHLTHIRQKSGLGTKPELAILAHQHNLL